MMEDGAIGFIMAERLRRKNLQSNPHDAYLFIEEGGGFRGKRLALTRLSESEDRELIERVRLAYVHLCDHSSMGSPPVKDEIKRSMRERFGGALILAGGYDRARAERDLVEKRANLIAFGRPFIANPRLVSRLRQGTALAEPDQSTFYTPGEKGYTDYPLGG